MGNVVSYLRQVLEDLFYSSLSYFLASPISSNNDTVTKSGKRATRRSKAAKVRPNYFLCVPISNANIQQGSMMKTVLFPLPNAYHLSSVIFLFSDFPLYFSSLCGPREYSGMLPLAEAGFNFLVLSPYHFDGFPSGQRGRNKSGRSPHVT